MTAEYNMTNFILMMVQCFLYSIFFYGFAGKFYNIIIPILTAYFVVVSITNIYKGIKKQPLGRVV
jgi:hypothetical protein